MPRPSIAVIVGSPALGNKSHCIRFAQDACRGRGRELTNGMTRDTANEVSASLQQHEQREETGGDDERLGNPRVADRVSVRDGAVRSEVEPSRIRESREAFRQTGHLKPGGKEPGGLRALSGADDDDHFSSLPIHDHFAL